MDGYSVERDVKVLRQLLEERLRIRGRDLGQQISKAGRLLPKRVRKDARYVEEAQHMLAHPKLRLMVDEARVAAAHGRVVHFLKTVDPKELRKSRLLGIAGVIAFNLIVIFALVLGVTYWRGFI